MIEHEEGFRRQKEPNVSEQLLALANARLAAMTGALMSQVELWRLQARELRERLDHGDDLDFSGAADQLDECADDVQRFLDTVERV